MDKGITNAELLSEKTERDILLAACRNARKMADAIATWGGNDLNDATRDALANIANVCELAIAKAMM